MFFLVGGLFNPDLFKNPSAIIQENLEQSMDILARGTLRANFVPRKGYMKPVVWRPRECNKVADYLPNRARHEGRDNEHINWDLWEQLEVRIPLAIQCFVDGGYEKATGNSSIGVYLHVFVTNTHGLRVTQDKVVASFLFRQADLRIAWREKAQPSRRLPRSSE
jgi:hypothetical protein